jgi:UDP-glucose 4-epimerase
MSRTATEVAGATRVVTGHYGELARSGGLAPYLRGHDAIIHLGDGLGILQEARHAADTELADRLIGNTLNAFGATCEQRIPLFVYVSSIKALCDEDDERVLVEDSDPRPTTLYGRSKLRTEQGILSAAGVEATRTVILRNPVMYDGAKRGSLHRLLWLANLPLPLPLARLTNKRSLLAVRNFAAALAAVVRAGPAQAPGVYHVHDGPALSTTEIVTTLRAALGRRLCLFPIGPAAAAIARQAPLLGPAARRLYGSLELSDALFRRNFRWTPVVGTKSALTEMVQHWRGRPAAQ